MKPHLGQFQVEVTAKGGFPLLVTGTVAPADRDVGLMTSYFDDFEIRTLKGGGIAFLNLSEDEYERIEEQVWDKLEMGE